MCLLKNLSSFPGDYYSLFISLQRNLEKVFYSQIVMQAASHLPELLHVQTNTAFPLPPNLSVIHIGKPGGQTVPDIDVSGLPDADVVSRVHAQIWVQGSDRQIVDMGSANGTYLNNVRLRQKTSTLSTWEIGLVWDKEIKSRLYSRTSKLLFLLLTTQSQIPVTQEFLLIIHQLLLLIQVKKQKFK